jgi:hypothetical protein
LNALSNALDGRVIATYIAGRCVPMMSGSIDLT